MIKRRKSETAELQAKVLMVVNALARAKTTKELRKDPLLSELTGQALGANLRRLLLAKQVRKTPNGWLPVRERTTAEAPADVTGYDMSFVYDTASKVLQLEVRGIKLPFRIE